MGMLVVGLIILLVTFWVAGKIARTFDMEEGAALLALLLVAAGLALFTTVPWVGMLTDGLMPNYSNGVREGYIVKVSQKGIIWKTWDVQIQIGTGEMAALQAPEHFSVEGGKIGDIESNLGKRVVVTYHEWLVTPYHVGDSGKVITNIEIK